MPQRRRDGRAAFLPCRAAAADAAAPGGDRPHTGREPAAAVGRLKAALTARASRSSDTSGRFVSNRRWQTIRCCWTDSFDSEGAPRFLSGPCRDARSAAFLSGHCRDARAAARRSRQTPCAHSLHADSRLLCARAAHRIRRAVAWHFYTSYRSRRCRSRGVWTRAPASFFAPSSRKSQKLPWRASGHGRMPRIRGRLN